MSDPDAWLDAFDPDDLDQPALHDFDRSVDRLLVRTPRPARRRRGWGLLALAAALALAVGTWFGRLLPAEPAEDAPVPVVVEEPGPGPLPDPVHPTSPPRPLGPARPSSPARPSPRVSFPIAEVLTEPAPPELPPPAPVRRQPGLLPYDGAVVHLEEGTAVLESGMLRYLHDRAHDPGVERVRLGALPVIATPVGTDFTVAMGPDLGAILVEDGVVRLELVDGSLLALLGAGDELAIARDRRSPLGLQLLDTDGYGLNELPARAAFGGRATGQQLVALVASLRLATHPEPLPLALPDGPP